VLLCVVVLSSPLLSLLGGSKSLISQIQHRLAVINIVPGLPVLELCSYKDGSTIAISMVISAKEEQVFPFDVPACMAIRLQISPA
jgi:hypothetical protein